MNAKHVRDEFTVFWHDLSYSIDEGRRKTNLIDSLSSSLLPSSKKLAELLRGPSCGSYDIEQMGKDHDVSGEEIHQILVSVSGSFKSGQLTALMGPSGAGKTSLLNILSRRNADKFSGHLGLESPNWSGGHKLRINAIHQNDQSPGCFTVRENLMFASRLKNAACVNHEANVQRVSSLLALEKCLETKTSSISGGQQKRLSIGQELMSKPDVLFMDEPTSGLDSSSALKILALLKSLVRAPTNGTDRPMAVVLSIHQVQPDAFSMFDKLCVMAVGGRTIYDGPPGKCVEYAQRHTSLSSSAVGQDLAWYMLDIASGEFGPEPIEQLEQQVRRDFKLSKKCATDPTRCIHKRQTASATMSVRTFTVDEEIQRTSSAGTKWSELSSMTRVLFERFWRAALRNPSFILLRFVLPIVVPCSMALVAGTDLGKQNACPRFEREYALADLVNNETIIDKNRSEEQVDVMGNFGIIYLISYTCISANIGAATIVFALDMQNLVKEYHNGWYTVGPYLFALILSSIPMDLMISFIMSATLFPITGQDTGFSEIPLSFRILIMSSAVFLTSCCGQLLGLICTILLRGKVSSSLYASQGAMLPSLMLSGFLIRTKNMPRLTQILSETSIFKHCLHIVHVARFGWDVCGRCDPQIFTNNSGPVISGVPQRLEDFVEFWQNSQRDNDEQQTQTSLFHYIAKQISLFDSYGLELKSCDQMVPSDMYDRGIKESDLIHHFVALCLLLSITLSALLMIAQSTLTNKSSL